MALTDYELLPTARRTLNLFIMVDSSSSMAGEKIAAVNDAIRNVIPFLSTINDDNPDALIKVSVLEFSAGCKWLTPEPVLASDFKWTDINADGWTNMGAATTELSSKLSHKHGFLTSASGSYAPVIIMLSDGAPTDDFNAAMTSALMNNWFLHSMRIAIAIGSDADVNVLKTFTGNPELVFRVSNIDALKSVIKATVVTSSMVASRSSSVGAIGTNGLATVDGTLALKDTPVITKSSVAAAALAEELEDVSGLSVGDEALINSLDYDDFD